MQTLALILLYFRVSLHAQLFRIFAQDWVYELALYIVLVEYQYSRYYNHFISDLLVLG